MREVFRLQINEWFKKSIFSNTARLTAFWKAFEEGDTEGIEQYLNRILSNSISVFDTKARKEEKEISYHNLLVGILTGNADWLVKSNVEAGEGFADIIVETDDPDAGIVVEMRLGGKDASVVLDGEAFARIGEVSKKTMPQGGN